MASEIAEHGVALAHLREAGAQIPHDCAPSPANAMTSRLNRRSGSAPAHLLWAVCTTTMPAFINDGVPPPFQPIVAAVVNGHGLVIGHGT